MRIAKTKVYKFSELSETAQQKAIEWFLTDYPEYDWWESVYDDARENSGIEITESDTYRGDIKGKFITNGRDSAEMIIKNHGATCDTYATASIFLGKIEAIKESYLDGAAEIPEEKEADYEQEIEEAEEDFLHAILQDYLSNLKKEEEYLTSEEHAREMIEANDYEFTENGSIF